MKFCPQCGTEYDAQVEYCAKDGAALSSTPVRADQLVGRVLDRKYRILEKLGGGGMGIVFKAEHIFLNKIVALKVLHSHLSADPEYLQRFQREARTACKIIHPSAILLHDFGVDGELPYLAMDYIEGRTLAEVLKVEGKLSRERVYRIVSQISGALAEAHLLGVVHRDLKPENIMLSVKKDGTELAQVLDFGIAKILHVENEVDTPLTKFGTVFGSPKYMAPEQALQGEIDQRTDLYALGVVIYEMLTGTVPFDISSPLAMMVKHAHDIPKALQVVAPQEKFSDAINAVVMRLLEKEKENRYPSIKEFLVDFDAAFVPEGVRVAGVDERGQRGLRSYAPVVTLAVLASLVIGYLMISRPVDKGDQVRLRKELEQLEVVKISKQREAEEATKAAEQKRSEAEVAQQEAERQRAYAVQVQRETEALKSEWLEEESRIEQYRADAAQAAKLASEQRVLADKAAQDFEEQKQARAREEERATEIQREAEKAAQLVQQQKEEALRAAEEAESHRIQRLEEEKNALKLKADAEAAAAAGKKLEAELQKAEATKLELEQSAKDAEERRAKAEEAIKQAEQRASAQREQEAPKAAVKSDAAEAKRAAVMRELEEAERKRLVAIRAADEADRKRIAAEKAARDAELNSARTSQSSATASSAAGGEEFDGAGTESESERKRLPKQGKKRF